jgi:hypothetical protein
VRPIVDFELDHLIVFISPEAPRVSALTMAGLRESFRQKHSGQGTANACYCFDNIFLELLYETDRTETKAAPGISRLRLADRANWPRTGASPFGIAIRKPGGEGRLPFDWWTYAAPHLESRNRILVATDSDDIRQPLVFYTSRGQRPDAWPSRRAGERQRSAGLTEITSIHLTLRRVTPAPAIAALADQGLISLGSPGRKSQMVLVLGRIVGAPLRLELPGFQWL